MRTYLVRIIFRIVCGNGDHTAQFDEQLRLLKAEDEKEAYEKARTFVQQEEEGFLNNSLQVVKWQFAGIVEITEIRSFDDGMELYSRVHETDEADRYLESVRKKAAVLESKLLLYTFNC
jgi:hypothetical protein